MSLISVIIPTANRPDYLGQAIDSALASASPDCIEVIVVPNGPDRSWEARLDRYVADPRVVVSPIASSHANLARNHGLELARGDYVRFLDDDDYLFPEAARRQYDLLNESGADVASGDVAQTDENGACFHVSRQSAIADFCAATLGPRRVCLPTAHLYRRSAIANLRWNPDTDVRQDVEWQLDLCAARELSWVKLPEQVGVWRHHWNRRVSRAIRLNRIQSQTVPMILRTYERLRATGRLTDERRKATAQGLWGLVHETFYLAPRQWSEVARMAGDIDERARPPTWLFQSKAIQRCSPLLIEWALLPKRWTQYRFRALLRQLRWRH